MAEKTTFKDTKKIEDPVSRHNIRVLADMNSKDLRSELLSIGADTTAIRAVFDKMKHVNLLIENLDEYVANVLKMEMLSLGSEAALRHDVYFLKKKKTSVILSGNLVSLKRIIKKIPLYGNAFADLADELRGVLKNLLDRPKIFKAGQYSLRVDKKVLIMGILNVTPDSFYDGGRYLNRISAISRIEEMIDNGADIIDVGGESTRPGSDPVSIKEEIKRTVPIIKEIVRDFDVPVSIDTSKWQVASEALSAGAVILNDVTGFKSKKMIGTAAGSDCGCAVMHMQGEPRNMQTSPAYNDAVGEIIDILRDRTSNMEARGIKRDRICIDPGIGFGKTLEHNLEILRDLQEFNSLPYPILLGTSRKAFIGKLIGSDTDNRLWGSLTTYVAAIKNGARIIRVHDVKEAARVAAMTKAIIDA